MGEIQKGFRNPEQDLELAIQTLEKFTAKKSDNFSLNHTFKLTQKGVPESILSAIHHVRRYHRFVTDKLPHGNPQQQKLAARAIDSIQKFNAMSNAVREPCTWKGQIFRFFINHSGLDFLQQTIDLPSKADLDSNPIIEKVTSCFRPVVMAKEEDLFRAKAISMLSQQGTSVSEALRIIRETPIVAKSSEHILESSTITLSQTLTPFPGETIIVKGSFERNANTRTGSVPLPETFQVTSSSLQTGFPHHPSLYTGWTLPQEFIPDELIYREKLPLFSIALTKKRETMQALLPKGALIDRAKEQLKLRRMVFNTHATHFLMLHEKLVRCISDSDVVSTFFAKIRQDPSPFKTLSTTFHQINAVLVTAPYKRLLSTWMDEQNHELRSLSPSKRFNAAKTILNREVLTQMKTIQSDFILEMAQKLCEPYHIILLQTVSEMMDFPAPEFDEKARRFQSILYNQLETFILALDDGRLVGDISMREHLCHCLEKDIDCLSREEFEHPIVDELELYFNL